MLKGLSLFIIIILLTGCSKEVDVTIPSLERSMVVYSYNTVNDSIFFLKLSSTANMYDTIYPQINDAIVIVSSDNMIDTLNYIDSSEIYFSQTIAIKDEVELEIVKYPYKTIQASEVVPEKINLIECSAIPNAGIDTDGFIYSEVTIRFRDIAGMTNFFEIVLSEDIKGEEPFTIFSEDPSIKNEDYFPNTMLSPYPVSLPFKDILFDGREQTITIRYDAPLLISEETIIPYQKIYVHFRSVTENYFKYKTSLIIQENAKNGDIIYGMSEPVEVFTNILNGYGIFSVYQSEIIEIEMPEVIVK